MKNTEIIAMALKKNGIREEVDTYQGWKNRGHQVRRGQKALFTEWIWKPCYNKTSGRNDNEDDADNENASKRRMILVKASFFGRSQVEDMNALRSHGWR